MKHTHLILISILLLSLLVGGVQALTTTTWTSGPYTYVVFNESAWSVNTTSWTPPATVTNVSFLAVGGGAGGGGAFGGGGGAGGYNTTTTFGGVDTPFTISPGTSISITVGVGGDGGVNSDGGPTAQAGGMGGSSIIVNGGTTITGYGGGGGGSYVGGTERVADRGLDGGSGGAASGYAGAGLFGSNGTATHGLQGNNAGAGLTQGGSTWECGGGGGAGGIGGHATISAGGNGGVGLNNAITGVDTGYAGGGGGTGYPAITSTASHGGGAGTNTNTGTNGTKNTGGGGGASGQLTGGTGGSGGSGIVVLRYLTPVAPVASFTSTNISVATNSTGQAWAGVSPFTMGFTDTSNGAPTTWNWSMQGYGINTTYSIFSTLQSPTNIFVKGNWSIGLNVTNVYGYNNSIQNTFVNVSAGPSLISSFTSNWLSGSLSANVAKDELFFVQFNDTTTWEV